MLNSKADLNRANFFGLVMPLLLIGCGGGKSSSGDLAVPIEEINTLEDEPLDVLVEQLSQEDPLETEANNPPHSIFLSGYFNAGDEVIGNIQFSDENPDTVSILISGTDEAKFYIEDETLVKIRQSNSVDAQTDYQIVITIIDDVGQQNQKQISLTKVAAVEVIPQLDMQIINIDADAEVTIAIYLDTEIDPGALGIESLGLRIDFDVSNFQYVVGSFETLGFDLGILNDLDINIGKLSYAGISAAGPIIYGLDPIAIFKLQAGDNFSSSEVTLYDVNLDGQQFGSSEIIVQNDLIT
mgnify:CR=1 FL=1